MTEARLSTERSGEGDHAAIGSIELALSNVPHLHEKFYVNPIENVPDPLSLPFSNLQGPGLERLCFQLLLAKGFVPRFFGKSGQAQYGIDLITSDGKTCIVYQCKNVAEFSRPLFESWLDKFAVEWLQKRPKLPRPVSFILVCPLEIKEREEVEEVKQTFAQKHEITVDIWHREALAGWLKDEPDIVADLFSEDIAQRFCNRPNWNQGLFRPVKLNSGEARAIDRFLELKAKGAIVRDNEFASRFEDVITAQKLVVIAGRSGSGKTITTLDLATSLHNDAWRVFYTRISYQTSEDNLVNGIEERAVRPTIFILDDCHLDLDRVSNVVDRLRNLLKRRKILLVLIMQGAKPDEDVPGVNQNDLIDQCMEDGAVLQLDPGVALYRAILTRTNPALTGLSEERVNRIYDLSCRDLVLLDELISLIPTPAAVDALNIEDLYEATLKRYFRNVRVHAPQLARLAAIAQFDLAMPLTYLQSPFEAEYDYAVKRLTVRIGPPLKCTFVHASAAEMVCRSLSWAKGRDSYVYVEDAAHDILWFLLHANDSFDGWASNLLIFLRSRLKLSDDTGLKQRILGSDDLTIRLTNNRNRLPVEILTRIALLAHDSLPKIPSGAWLSERIESLLDKQEISGLVQSIDCLKRVNPQMLTILNRKLSSIVQILAERGSIFDLFGILRHITPEFSEVLLAALENITICRLIDRTIAEGRSIGTLHLKLAKLDKPNQLKMFEDKIGCDNLLRLIMARGTIVELLRILQYSAAEFSSTFIAALDEVTIGRLVNRAIIEGRSIGTLGLYLRELGQRNQLEAFENKMAADAMVRLISERGTMVDLLRIVEHTTPAFSAKLIAALDPATVGRLIEQTIAEARSISTIDLSLRELAHRKQLQAFEDKIGPDGMLRLILEHGTIPELLRILQHSTPAFAKKLIAALDEAALEQLVERTVAEGRSIGTLHLALRVLAYRKQLQEFEDKIGPDGMLRLVLARGTFIELVVIVRYSTPAFAEKLIAVLNQVTTGRLIDRTIAERRSIGTLAFSLRELNQRNQLKAFEDKIGPQILWKLVAGCGDLNDLAYLLSSLSNTFCLKFLEPGATPSKQWRAVCDQSDFYAASRFARDSFHLLPEGTVQEFLCALAETAAAMTIRASWRSLTTGLIALDEVSNQSIQQTLRNAATDRLSLVRLEDMRFDDLLEAASAFTCIRNWRPDLWPTIAESIWQSIRNVRDWPEDYTLFLSGHLLLALARYPEVPQQDAEKILRAFTLTWHFKGLEKVEPQPLFLFVWNLYAVWYERGKHIRDRFIDLQPSEFWNTVISIVDEQAQQKDNESKLAVLRLAGVLSFFLPELQSRLKVALKTKLRGVEFLMEAATELTMVPAFFTLQGLSLLYSTKACFSDKRRKSLLAASAEYVDRGSAIEYLCEWLRHGHQTRN